MTNSARFDDAARCFLAKMKDAGRPVISSGGELYCYKDGVWRPGVEADEWAVKVLYGEAVANKISMGKDAKAMWNTVRIVGIPDTPVRMDPHRMIVCTNGTLDVESRDLYEHSPDHYCTRFVDIEYDAGAECPEWIAALHRTLEGHEDIPGAVNLLQEFFGISLVGKRNLPRALRQAMVLWGLSKTGKSSVANVLKAFFPANVTSVGVKEATSQFGLSTFVGAMAWISEEAIERNFRGGANVLKKLLIGEPVSADRKYKDRVEFVFDGAVLLTANNELRVSEASAAVFNRLAAIRFERVFTDEDAKHLVGGKLETHLRAHNEWPGILNWALDGAERAIERGHYVMPEAVKTTAQDWRRDDPVIDFLEQCTEYDPRVQNVTRTVATACAVFATRNHDTRLSVKKAVGTLSSEIKSIHPRCEGRVKRYGAGDRGHVLIGLRLNDEGVKWVEQAKQDGVFLIGESVKVNLAAL